MNKDHEARTLRALVASAVTVLLLATAIVGGFQQPATAAAEACVATFRAAPQAQIPDAPEGGWPGSVDLTLPAGPSLPIVDLDVHVGISHGSNDDLTLEFYIYASTGTYPSVLSERVGGPAADGYADTWFDDDATVGTAASQPPFVGAYRPLMGWGDEVITQHDNDRFLLRVIDSEWGGVGVVNSWEVRVRYQTCDFDKDGVEDHVDNCVGLANAAQADTDKDRLGDACDADDDGDGRPDTGDACGLVAAATVSGCPVHVRSVSLAYQYAQSRFAGRVVAPSSAACQSQVRVTVWRIRKGPDQKVGTRVTGVDGRFVLNRDRRAGRYYAVAGSVAPPGQGECLAARSSRLRVR